MKLNASWSSSACRCLPSHFSLRASSPTFAFRTRSPSKTRNQRWPVRLRAKRLCLSFIRQCNRQKPVNICCSTKHVLGFIDMASIQLGTCQRHARNESVKVYPRMPNGSVRSHKEGPISSSCRRLRDCSCASGDCRWPTGVTTKWDNDDSTPRKSTPPAFTPIWFRCWMKSIERSECDAIHTIKDPVYTPFARANKLGP